MAITFFKYHSLLNDLIILDRFEASALQVREELTDAMWRQQVIFMCDRHGGIGGDCVIVLAKNFQTALPEMFIYNSDGSQAENCLNGLRCIAVHLVSFHGFPYSFSVQTGSRISECIMGKEPLSEGSMEVITQVGGIHYEGQKEIISGQKSFLGHIVSIGNPHCIIFSEPSSDWQVHGKNIEADAAFPHRTNVEFVWDGPKDSYDPEYHVVVYERGGGPTMSCSSGAAAITGLLAQQGKIAPLQKVKIHMPGGSQCGWVNSCGQVFLQAKAGLVFTGTWMPFTP